MAAHDPARHAQEILELDAQKFRIAKAASDLEIESERLEGDLEMLKERLAELEAQGLEGDETVRREREADDATMYVSLACPAITTLIMVDCVSRSIAPLESMLKPTTLAITTRLLSETVARVMSMWSTSIQSSLGFSMRTTSGKLCRDNLFGLFLCGFTMAMTGVDGGLDSNTGVYLSIYPEYIQIPFINMNIICTLMFMI